MLEIFISLYCKMLGVPRQLIPLVKNLDSNLQGRVLKIDVIKTDFSGAYHR